jgi:syntaxin-binding protein 1
MNTEGKQRMIVFVAGGMTYSEMRLAYTVGQSLGKEIFIGKSNYLAKQRISLNGLYSGSTHTVTPEGFVKDLKALGRGGIAGNPPNPIPVHPQSPGRPARSPGRPTDYQKWVLGPVSRQSAR